ncbi:MAG TPA: cytochrome c oxidase assembly factor Coa1 family protein [Acidobacteriaceae bacterium]|nr:cytochrome c oxidase assembly factor Coa1 family protein [Acidobacteriaceae bacterium]
MDETRPGWFRTHLTLVLVVWAGLGLLAGVYACTLVRTSDVTKLAITTAVSNPVVLEQVGSPMQTGWLFPAKITLRRDSGHARFSIPISGPRGSGTLYTEGLKEAGVWRLVMLEFKKYGSPDRIDLLANGAIQPAAPPQ